MTSDEHKSTAIFIKNVHQNLRELSKIHGDQLAWEMHIQNEDMLQEYSENMLKLSECYWSKNLKQHTTNECRIAWTMNYIEHYFYGNNDDDDDRILKIQRLREKRIATKLGIPLENHHQSELQHLEIDKIALLDVGSCFNPFSKNEKYDVTAIDIAPADPSVHKCDFLNVNLSDRRNNEFEGFSELTELPHSHFEVVVFSLFLEYLPTSNQRRDCCLKAYNLLKSEGILIIVTPDSSHKQLNAKLMKNWRYTLGIYGFSRIKIDNLKHITCMVFRKSIDKAIPRNWSNIHKESYMTAELKIPQDYNFDVDYEAAETHIRKNLLLS